MFYLTIEEKIKIFVILWDVFVEKNKLVVLDLFKNA